MSWRALILAGSRGPDDPVAEAAGVPHKALAEIAGRAMLDWVVEALRGCPEIDEIAVCAPPDLALEPGLRRVPVGATPALSVLAGVEDLAPPVLITTADNPLLASATVAGFLEATTASGADITAGLAPRDVVEQAGNPGKRTYLTFRDGAYSGCNLFALNRPGGRAAIDFWRRVEADRKRPWRMAQKIGVGTLASYLAGRLTLEGAVGAIAQRTGCRAAPILLEDPFAAHDVDKASDLAFATQVLAERQAAGAHG